MDCQSIIDLFAKCYDGNLCPVLSPKLIYGKQQCFQVAAISPLCSPPCKSVGGLGEHRTTKHNSTSPLPSRFVSKYGPLNITWTKTVFPSVYPITYTVPCIKLLAPHKILVSHQILLGLFIRVPMPVNLGTQPILTWLTTGIESVEQKSAISSFIWPVCPVYKSLGIPVPIFIPISIPTSGSTRASR